MIGRLSDFLAPATLLLHSNYLNYSLNPDRAMGHKTIDRHDALFSINVQCINMSSRPRHLAKKNYFLKSCQNILYEVLILSLLWMGFGRLDKSHVRAPRE